MNAEAYVAGAAQVGPRRSTLGALLATSQRLLNQGIALLLLLLSPLLALVAFLIWRRDGAPIFFGHYRVGHDGRIFRCLKFRTMLRDAEPALAALLARSPTARAEWQRDQKLLDDPRVTPVGRFLRRTSLDELPQLINVLRGEMNLVGPHPLSVGGLTHYGRVRWPCRSGRNSTSSAQVVSPDRPYVEPHAAAADVRILRKTVHGPVGAAYFAATPPAERHPLVVGASRVADPLATAAFDQLALLLGSGGLGLAFHWLGPLDPVPAARLKAAHVDVFDPQDDVERATRMAAGWIFVAMGTGHRFPISLVEAMATGLPCVVMDNPGHRSLVHHGETGYLCRSPGEAVDRIAQLADTPSLRERMGRAGRVLALARFGERRFRDTLLAAYAALPMPAAANAHTHQRLQSWNSSSASDRL